MDNRINEAAFCRKRDEWFARMQDFFDGRITAPRGFRMLGTAANMGINVCNDPEGRVEPLHFTSV